jgi:hypothetical protein
MPATVKMTLVVDARGHVLGAQLAAGTDRDKTAPALRLRCAEGQRAIDTTVPREILSLPGADLQSFLAEVRVHPTGKVQLPRLKVVRKGRK